MTRMYRVLIAAGDLCRAHVDADTVLTLADVYEACLPTTWRAWQRARVLLDNSFDKVRFSCCFAFLYIS